MLRRLATVGLSAFLVGCSFSRAVTNAQFAALDTSWIEPGVTTKDDVIARIGRPPAVLGAGQVGHMDGDGMARFYAESLALRPAGVDAVGEDIDGAEMNAFRWSVIDTYRGQFEGGKWIIPTIAKGGTHRAHDILILFDSRDVVTLLSRTAVEDGKLRVLEWKEAK